MSSDRLRQSVLDEGCIRLKHHERDVEHCKNPCCPGTHPELWEEFLKVHGIRERRESGDGDGG